ncbi:hypothetical protein N1851_002731 [Merluccius polli]|uniref:Sushi domain-containing protein n=1 Tax=Merluccius polli TaxID=89951 RepID=A0AA47N9K9_MERPO|nr:hypothetical protein N1851_002731 [Merluccius polli]
MWCVYSDRHGQPSVASLPGSSLEQPRSSRASASGTSRPRPMLQGEMGDCAPLTWWRGGQGLLQALRGATSQLSGILLSPSSQPLQTASPGTPPPAEAEAPGLQDEGGGWAKQCGAIPQIPNARAELFAWSVRYSCNDGYKIKGSISQEYWYTDGSWSSQRPQCEADAEPSIDKQEANIGVDQRERETVPWRASGDESPESQATVLWTPRCTRRAANDLPVVRFEE